VKFPAGTAALAASANKEGRMANRRHLALAATAGLVLAAAAPAAHATVLLAPGFGPPDLLTLGVGSIKVADTGLQLFSNPKYSGTIEEWVYEDTANVWGSGDLTFIISVHNNKGSKDSLGRITAADFSCCSVDVGDNGGSNGPNQVTRDSGGTQSDSTTF
jgi:hypothetical protein